MSSMIFGNKSSIAHYNVFNFESFPYLFVILSCIQIVLGPRPKLWLAKMSQHYNSFSSKQTLPKKGSGHLLYLQVNIIHHGREKWGE